MSRDTSGIGRARPDVRAYLKRRPSRLWAFSFLGFLLLTSAWALAMPYDGPPDELQHVERAYGVVTGHIVPDSLGEPSFRVPKSLIPRGSGISSSCFRWHTEIPASCTNDPGAEPGSEHHFVQVDSGAGTYNPVYYLMAGEPIRLWPNFGGVIAARLITSGIMSAFFASALSLAARLRRGRWMTAGVIVAVTPVAVNLGGGVNPAGPEIAAGVALWAALIAIVDAEEISAATVAVAGLAASGLAVFRGFGLGLLAAVGFFAALGLSRSRMKTLVRDRAVQIWGAVLAVFMAFALIWQKSVNTILPAKPTLTDPSHSTLHVATAEVWDRLIYYTEGLVGLTSYGDVRLPGVAFTVFYAAAGAVIGSALIFCRWRSRLRIGGIIAASYLLLALPDIHAVRQGWWLSQGRYALPLIAGAPMLAAYRLGAEKVFDGNRFGQLIRAVTVVLLPFQLLALWVTMIRFQSGNPGGTPIHLNPFNGSWLPPFGPVVPTVLCVAGIAVIGTACFRVAARTAARCEDTAAAPADRPTAADAFFKESASAAVTSPATSTN